MWWPTPTFSICLSIAWHDRNSHQTNTIFSDSFLLQNPKNSIETQCPALYWPLYLQEKSPKSLPWCVYGNHAIPVGGRWFNFMRVSMNDKRVLFVRVTDISGPKGCMLKMVLILQLTFFKLSHYKCGSGQQLPWFCMTPELITAWCFSCNTSESLLETWVGADDCFRCRE